MFNIASDSDITIPNQVDDDDSKGGNCDQDYDLDEIADMLGIPM